MYDAGRPGAATMFNRDSCSQKTPRIAGMMVPSASDSLCVWDEPVWAWAIPTMSDIDPTTITIQALLSSVQTVVRILSNVWVGGRQAIRSEEGPGS